MSTSYILRIPAPNNGLLLLPHIEELVAQYLGDIDRARVTGYITPDFKVQHFEDAEDVDVRSMADCHIGQRGGYLEYVAAERAVCEIMFYCAPAVQEYIKTYMFDMKATEKLDFLKKLMPDLVKESARHVDTKEYPYFNLSTLSEIAEGTKCPHMPFFDDISKMFWPLQNYAYADKGLQQVSYIFGDITW